MFPIYNVQEKPKPKFYWRLIPNDKGGTTLIVANEDGSKVLSGNVLDLNEDGTFSRRLEVNRTVGLQLDSCGKLVEKP